MPKMFFEKEMASDLLKWSQVPDFSGQKINLLCLFHLVRDSYVLTPITLITVMNVRLRTKTQSYNTFHLAAFEAQMVLGKPYKSGFSVGRRFGTNFKPQYV